jgi:hypothetical protein
MKPVNEWTLTECYAYLREMIWLDVHRGNHLEVIDRMESLTRWIPVTERLPTEKDGDFLHAKVEGEPYALTHEGVAYSHWRRIDRPEAHP